MKEPFANLIYLQDSRTQFLHANAQLLFELAYSFRTAGVVSLCNVFCMYRRSLFFSCMFENMIAFYWWDLLLPFWKTELFILKGCCNISTFSNLGKSWSDVVQDKHFFLLSWSKKTQALRLFHTTTLKSSNPYHSCGHISGIFFSARVLAYWWNCWAQFKIYNAELQVAEARQTMKCARRNLAEKWKEQGTGATSPSC